MKKLFIFLILAMSMVIANAQTDGDTIFFNPEIQFVSNETVDDSIVVYNIIDITDIYQSADTLTISFDIDTMYDGNVFVLYVINAGHVSEYSTDTNGTPIFNIGHNKFNIGDSVEYVGIRLVGDEDRSDTVILYNVTVTCVATEDLDIESVESLKCVIYPNPVSNKIYIQGEFDRLIIYNINGRLMESTTDHEIDVSNYPAGTYLIRIDDMVITVVKK